MKKWITLLPAAAVMILIFVHSAMDADTSLAESNWFTDLIEALFPGAFSGESLTFFVRKTGHFMEYLLLGLTLRWGIGKLISRRPLLTAWVVGTAYAVTDEIHQLFVPGRSCEFRDICIDAAGVLVGAVIMTLVMRARTRRQQQRLNLPGNDENDIL